jgi:hypothetical protein
MPASSSSSARRRRRPDPGSGINLTHLGLRGVRGEQLVEPVRGAVDVAVVEVT